VAPMTSKVFKLNVLFPQKRLKHGRQNITLHWINGIIRNNKCIFTKLNAVFILYQKFSRLKVLFICYGTAVNIGVCWIDQVFVTELTVVIFFVHAAVLSIKTAFNLVKIHLLFRIIPLIQWSVMFCRPCFNRFWGLKYIRFSKLLCSTAVP
jgi:hypothetical protein